MSSLTRPRGPLPPRVYWTRRLSVLGIALLLVFGIGRVLGSNSDGSSDSGIARQAAAQPSETSRPSTTKAPGEKKRAKKKRKQATAVPTPTEPVLAEPSGPCVSTDIVVTPQIFKEEGGSPVLISLELTTRDIEACTWTVSPETLTLKISSGADDIWSSRQCPTSVPTREVVVRQDFGTLVGVRWNGRRSDATCSALTEWALPGYYHVVAAALAGEPTDVQFKLTRAGTTVVTTTITPSPKAGGGKNGGKNGGRKKPSDPVSPTGATEPR